MNNLELWAISQGYDPEKDYTEGGLPPGYLTKNFREAEFACNHCGKLHPDGVPSDLLAALDRIRDHYGVPLNINSGYRCPAHNANVGGAPNSLHMQGLAVDFWLKGVSPAEVYEALDANWPEGGLGKYLTFTHIDVRGYRARW